MNNKILYTVLFTVLTTSVFAFKIGDEVELETFLNGRSSAKFSKESGNIRTQLSSGTHGKVAEVMKMPSGNYGIKMKVKNGAHHGESYWVYYNLKNPKIKLYDQKKTELMSDQISISESITLIEKQTAIREPEETAAIAAVAAVKMVMNNQTAPKMESPGTGSDCKPEVSAPSSDISEENYTVSDVVEPFRELASSPLRPVSCRTTTDGWDKCWYEKNEQAEGFKLQNRGPNNIVKTDIGHIYREMSFEFEDRARSDMKMIISDNPDDRTSHSTYSIMLFFPRSVLPAIKKVGEEFIVTLPNKEIVRYNAKTNEVVGGVFTEGPMVSDPKNKNKAKPADIKYTGEGVMIRADKSGDLPYGDIEINGKNLPSNTTATISKKGHKDCKVPSKEIWFTDNSKGGNVFIKPEFANDKGLDTFINKRCGFSLY